MRRAWALASNTIKKENTRATHTKCCRAILRRPWTSYCFYHTITNQVIRLNLTIQTIIAKWRQTTLLKIKTKQQQQKNEKEIRPNSSLAKNSMASRWPWTWPMPVFHRNSSYNDVRRQPHSFEDSRNILAKPNKFDEWISEHFGSSANTVNAFRHNKKIIAEQQVQASRPAYFSHDRERKRHRKNN